MTHAQPIQLAYGTEPLFPCPARVPLSPSLFLHLLLYIFPPLFPFLSFSFLFFSFILFLLPAYPTLWPNLEFVRARVKGKRCTQLLCRSSFEKVSPPVLERVSVLLASFFWCHSRFERVREWMDGIVDVIAQTKLFSKRGGIYENTRGRERRLEGKRV